MSRGQRPRTLDEFPRMKYRAAGRHMRNRERILKDFLALGRSASDSPFDALARLVEQWATEVVQPIVDRVREAFLGSAHRSDYALVPAPPAAPLGTSRHDRPGDVCASCDGSGIGVGDDPCVDCDGTGWDRDATPGSWGAS